MKAAIYENYGPPEVVKLVEIAAPEPKENEIQIQVIRSTVNRTDTGFRSAVYFVSRFWTGLFKPKRQILGTDFAGRVSKKGANVKAFELNDRVLGFDDEVFGSHAEYMTVAANKAVAKLDEKLTFDQGAALLEGAHYALTNIRAAGVKKGDCVMVYGATGAIGSAAVQLLKAMGIQVTAVGNSKNIALLRDLGADQVIDYQKEDFTKTAGKFQFIFDAVGKSSFKVCKTLLAEKGVYISTELGKNGINLILPLLTRLKGGKRVLFPFPSITKEDIDYLQELAIKGQYLPVIDRAYKLNEIVEAHQYVESGRKTGNVILKVQD